MENINEKNRVWLRNLVIAAVFTSLAFVSEFISIKVSFLTYDAKDAILTIGALFYGPVYGIISALVVAFLEMITISSTGIWGFLMNFISTGVFVFIASFIYSKWRTIKGAIVGLSSSVILMTGVMMGMNLLITPIYTGMSVDGVIKMIPTLLLPFNFTKALMNAALTLLLYKPIFTALRGAKIIKAGENMKFDKRTIIIMISGFILSLTCVLIMVFVLNK